jgi:4-hydroxythreonine-4-phosphate dehydrogenase
MKPILGITMGDPSGIGPEVVVRALCGEYKIREYCRPVVFGDVGVVREMVKLLRRYLAVRGLPSVECASFEPGRIEVVDLQRVDLNDLEYGRVSAVSGEVAFQAIRAAIDAAMQGKVDAVVTAPINKEALHRAGHFFSGHTEIFAHFTNTKKYAMLLADESLRIVHATTHVSLRDACNLITTERVLEVISLLHDACIRFGSPKPVIGVAGLNPHAGEGGLFGREEIDVIIPAIQQAQALGFAAEGPVPPDTLFTKALQGRYDGCVAMYHDQGHIPFKLAGFRWNNETKTMDSVRGVNITLGLPIIRTSVDHGTAFEIAGKGVANPDSMISAIEYAAKMAANKTK